MHQRTLTCSCGHSWEHPGAEQVPADLSTICPLCSGGAGTPLRTRIPSFPDFLRPFHRFSRGKSSRHPGGTALFSGGADGNLSRWPLAV
jgi:hypothetical protein